LMVMISGVLLDRIHPPATPRTATAGSGPQLLGLPRKPAISSAGNTASQNNHPSRRRLLRSWSTATVVVGGHAQASTAAAPRSWPLASGLPCKTAALVASCPSGLPPQRPALPHHHRGRPARGALVARSAVSLSQPESRTVSHRTGHVTAGSKPGRGIAPWLDRRGSSGKTARSRTPGTPPGPGQALPPASSHLTSRAFGQAVAPTPAARYGRSGPKPPGA